MNTFDKSLFDESISRRGLIRANISHRPSEEMDLDFSLTIAPNEMRKIMENATLTSTTFFGNQSALGSQSNISTIGRQKTDLLYTQFLEVIQSKTNDSEIFETVQDLILTLTNTIEEMETSNKKVMRNHWLREEENTWKLLFCLYKDRLIAQKENLEIEDLPLVNSEKTIVEHLYLSEYYLIFRKLL